ncbi:MAG: adenylate/guanylate cyclase domain-containing protein [Bacteroidota bacterium]
MKRVIILSCIMLWGLRMWADSIPSTEVNLLLRKYPETRQGVDDLNTKALQYARNFPNQALELAQASYARAEQLAYPQGIGSALQALAKVRWYQGAYPEARDNYQLSWETYAQLDDSVGIARSLHGIATVEWRFGNYAKAIEHLLLALSIQDHYRDDEGLGHSYLWMGIVKASVSEYKEAEDYYRDALSLAQNLGNKQLQADILNHMGRAFRKKGRYGAALEVHVRSFALYEELHDEVGISDYYNNVGSIYRRQQQYDFALEHFFKALRIQERLGDQEGLADSYNDIGTTYGQMREYATSIRYLRKALDIATRTGLKDDVRYAYSSLAATYDSLGNYQQAYAYYRKFHEVKEDLLNSKVNNEIANAHTEYEREKLDKKLKLEAAQRRLRSRTILIIILGIILLLMAFGGFFYWRARSEVQNARSLETRNMLIEFERERAETLLLNILPGSVAEELKQSALGRVQARSFEAVSVMFIDFKGFTQIAETLSPQHLVGELDYCFRRFDEIVESHGVEKIKTIGDAYMAAGGLPEPQTDHALRVVKACLEIRLFMQEYARKRKAQNQPHFEARIGIHSGPIVAGVVGSKKFAYDIWGDTVNTASRLETSGEVGRVNISHETYLQVKDACICTHRGKLPAKNKGEIDMYFVEWAM